MLDHGVSSAQLRIASGPCSRIILVSMGNLDLEVCNAVVCATG